MNFRWIWFIAARYIFRKKKKSPAPVLSILGIATGVLALIVILSVMNGFQLGFIESILEISSYHLRIGPVAGNDIEELRKAVLTLPGIKAAVPFREFQGLVQGKRGGQQAAIVRGLPKNALEMDSGLAGRISFEPQPSLQGVEPEVRGFPLEEGAFGFENKSDALLGAELARRLGVRIGDEITLFSIPSIFNAANDGSSGLRTFIVTGIFRTGFYEYDTSWIFIDIDSAAAFSESGPVLGLKLKNRFHDQQALELVRKTLVDNPASAGSAFAGAEFSSWRDYNRSFFGALRTEKLFMFILVGLIFIVVALNIYQAQRRSVLEHREEIGLLRAIGGGEHSVQLVFVLDGAIIGFSGASAGLCLGLLIASNIPSFFTVIETIVNFGVNIVNIIVGFFGGHGIGDFFFFSPAVFYIKEIPSRIIPGEVVLVFMFGLLSALLAAWAASRKVARIRPADVLRYE
ncbi:MAG: ABC transporter permease [Treponema sp.]|jgi:lipoprotein-releasing system permease protein|nr:ABC transporter permease [Treponema sp.]